jgi:hypothetical protein
MSACRKNETLQAFLDHELRARAMNSAASHLEYCATCQRELENVRARCKSVHSLLDTLLPEQVTEVAPGSIREFSPELAASHVRFVAAAVIGIAACALFAFIVLRHPAQSPISNSAVASYSTAKSNSSVALRSGSQAAPETPGEKSTVRSVARISKAARRGSPKPVSRSLDFIALDDGGPVESGMIVRMNLDSPPPGNSRPARQAKQVPVDVLLDEQGEVRAIRFVNGGAQ